MTMCHWWSFLWLSNRLWEQSCCSHKVVHNQCWPDTTILRFSPGISLMHIHIL
jgi:hypothetical protein